MLLLLLCEPRHQAPNQPRKVQRTAQAAAEATAATKAVKNQQLQQLKSSIKLFAGFGYKKGRDSQCSSRAISKILQARMLLNLLVRIYLTMDRLVLRRNRKSSVLRQLVEL
jgi:hypothetical protein